ncbi:PQQ-binding-like beta-propeller repeat protein [Myxococcus sp. AB056]|uniref:outer membrane protein assembly factor BamB family protein n=1 Tax=Myxococcus sp. AB056 TaxID=2562792 RepID=UPI00114677BF|nr:PQQ-binding-like beta-propeller repeat protein [Myxococcus sp. AB056]
MTPNPFLHFVADAWTSNRLPRYNTAMSDPLLITTVQGYVAAIDRVSGRVMWRHDLHDARVDSKLRGARTTVTLAVEPPFVAMLSVTWEEMSTHTGAVASWCVRLVCCDYASGRVLWTVSEDVKGWGRKPSISAMDPCLRIQQGQVLMGLSTVTAFDAASGRQLWRTSVAPEPESTQPTDGGFFSSLMGSAGAVRAEYWNCKIARQRD